MENGSYVYNVISPRVLRGTITDGATHNEMARYIFRLAPASTNPRFQR